MWRLEQFFIATTQNYGAALLNQAPSSSEAVEYGTPKMACEVARLFKVTDVQSRKIFVMAGHEGGIVAFGRDLEEALAVLMREWKQKRWSAEELKGWKRGDSANPFGGAIDGLKPSLQQRKTLQAGIACDCLTPAPWPENLSRFGFSCWWD
jgi:hypothetical protein